MAWTHTTSFMCRKKTQWIRNTCSGEGDNPLIPFKTGDSHFHDHWWLCNEVVWSQSDDFSSLADNRSYWKPTEPMLCDRQHHSALIGQLTWNPRQNITVRYEPQINSAVCSRDLGGSREHQIPHYCPFVRESIDGQWIPPQMASDAERDDKSKSIYVMAWCRHPTSHYLTKVRCLTPRGDMRGHCVKSVDKSP